MIPILRQAPPAVGAMRAFCASKALRETESPTRLHMPNKNYQVKEIVYTLQGEGAQSGRAAVFCRFAGCNLWSGDEADRAAAVCQFCDTDFVGADGPNGGEF